MCLDQHWARQRHITAGGYWASQRHITAGAYWVNQRHITVGAYWVNQKHITADAYWARQRHITAGAYWARQRHITAGAYWARQKNISVGAYWARQRPITAGAYFRSLEYKSIKSISTPPEWNTSSTSCQAPLPIVLLRFPFIHLGGEMLRGRCFVQEHNVRARPGLEFSTIRPQVRRNSATSSPTYEIIIILHNVDAPAE